MATVIRPPSSIVGSPEWIELKEHYMRSCLNNTSTNAERLLEYSDRLRRDEPWKYVGLAGWDDYCRERLEVEPDRFRRIECGAEILRARGELQPSIGAAERAMAMASDRTVAPMASHGGARVGAGRPSEGDEGNQVDNINLNPKGGTSAEYLVRRLKRDAPEIAQALARGEYRSARAAAIAAGIVHPPSPLEIAIRAIEKMDDEELEALMEHVGALLKGRTTHG